MRGITKDERAVSAFVEDNPSLEFKLTNHVFDRLRNRMGWSRKQALSKFPERLVRLTLSDSIVETAKEGAWKIHLFGWGKFVIVSDSETDEWVAVTFYPERS
ncbi:MAG: hypothetical protein QF709_04390 [Candidatus Thalassarchaeum sp.]|jgi:sarcosine oxidase gamma subunit|nr:hypothetical protein [Candidatus Thalassarchaeum sp.]